MKKSVIIALLVLFVLFAAHIIPDFGPDTIWNSDQSLQEYLERDRYPDWDITILKTARKDYVMSVIYQRDDQLCAAFFKETLFGLRWKYDGMTMLNPSEEAPLSMCGRWSRTKDGSRCDVEIVGDNRKGLVGAYEVEGHETMSREELESDFILDIYIMDGIDELPLHDELIQYTPEGQVMGQDK